MVIGDLIVTWRPPNCYCMQTRPVDWIEANFAIRFCCWLVSPRSIIVRFRNESRIGAVRTVQCTVFGLSVRCCAHSVGSAQLPTEPNKSNARHCVPGHWRGQCLPRPVLICLGSGARPLDIYMLYSACLWQSRGWPTLEWMLPRMRTSLAIATKRYPDNWSSVRLLLLLALWFCSSLTLTDASLCHQSRGYIEGLNPGLHWSSSLVPARLVRLASRGNACRGN